MKIARYLHARLCLTVLVLTLVACAQLGLEPAKSFEQNLAYSYAQVTSIRLSAASAIKTGIIKADDGRQVQTLADQARTGLDAAREAHGAGDTKTAMGRLQLANAVLAQLAVFLQQHGVK